MEQKNIKIDDREIPAIYVDTLVIGSGCAGLNAADCLYNLGRRNIALVTEGINMGTSRNTGSDKQTYYKLSVASLESDSVDALAQTLWSGGGVHGDHALAEAAGSVQAFMKLVEMGTPFPKNIYGEFVGYKTDHDPLQRATSCGPFTSKIMTETLEKSIRAKQINILDEMQIIKLLCDDSGSGVKTVKGAVALKNNGECVVILCNNIILCTGGPAAIYQHSVYPPNHTGNSGLAISAGAVMNNLQEWQYGLASTKFRWNVSGTFQQVLPKYISIDKDGISREFLLDYMPKEEVLSNVFLKGYQWPFDIRKINGSSVIDLIVYHETIIKGNRVYLDFRSEPCGFDINNLDMLSSEARQYLSNSDALIASPIKRLEQMNPKAIALYKSNGIDLYSEPLEIMVCSQHNNGGVAVDENWQTSIKGLYAAGEVAGTFGIYRPGGSALNSTQVGSRRAAEHIAYNTIETTEEYNLDLDLIYSIICESFAELETATGKSEKNHLELRQSLQAEMSKYAAQIRDIDEIFNMFNKRKCLINDFFNIYKTPLYELPQLYKTYDILITQTAVLQSMYCSGQEAGSRGSALILCTESAKNAKNTLTSDKINIGNTQIYYCVENEKYRKYACETQFLCTNEFKTVFIPVRPIPERDTWFETVWRDFLNYTKN